MFYLINNRKSLNISIKKFLKQKNRITQEIGKDPTPIRSLWNGIDEKWESMK